MIAMAKNHFRDDRTIVVAPSPDHRVQLPDEPLLRGSLALFTDGSYLSDLSLDSFFTWSDDRFETKWLSMSIGSCSVFPDRSLAYGETQEIHSDIPLVGSQCMAYSGFAWFQFSSDFSQPAFHHCLRLL